MIEKLQNIGEQKCVEEEFKLLQLIALEITEAENFHDALFVVLRNLCEFTGWIYGEVWLPSADKKYLERHMAWHTDSRELEEFKERGEKFTLPMGIGLPGHVWSSKKPVWAPDAIIQRDISCASAAKDPGLKVAMGIPVIVNDEALAIIIFFVREQREEDERFVNLISSIVVQLGATIRHKQMEESLLEREQLLHAQRLESLSKFAGNIAHDFNNILTAIIGYTELLQNKVKEDDSLNVYVQRILGTTERATKLTQDLLMFSRRQSSNPKPVNLNMIIKCAEQIFLRLVSENIKPEISLTRKDCIIMADSGQIEQVLINLVMNARDAMPDGGALTISTDSVEIDNEFIKTHGYGKTGKYALMMVSDTGIGMDEEMKKKIFEPFSTTKETGKGTGLGLAIVYGIVKQHQGYIHIDSKPGAGTICKIYLPLVEPEVEEKKPEVRDTVNK
ncbi:MAG: histidine kinase [Candidatus Jettenia ecosi]|uniref:histidine kinase n=1 Tax=Candidatus Jettenia ecosi TaxID=2494326 RepID=A0A533QBL1_9BACT|nr:MAG: histidine kinase [Candidatus Jettenia ecosi]